MMDFILGLFGLVLPVRWTSRLYLKAQLKANGVNTAHLSKDCLQDLTDFSISETKRLWQLWEKIWKSRIVFLPFHRPDNNEIPSRMPSPDCGSLDRTLASQFDTVRRHNRPQPACHLPASGAP